MLQDYIYSNIHPPPPSLGEWFVCCHLFKNYSKWEKKKRGNMEEKGSKRKG
jgi:hypothetical protein